MSSKKCLVYTRVSTKEQGANRNGLDAQLRDVKIFCECNNIEIVGSFEEIASGGSGLSERVVLASLIARCKVEGLMLLVSKLDRFSRSVEFVSSMMNVFVKDKVKFVSCEHGIDVDPFLLHLYAALAEKERILIGQRTKKGLESVKARGKILGNYTHKDGGEKSRNAARQAQVFKADAFAASVRPTIEIMLKQGNTLEVAAATLNQLAYPTPRGGKWSAASISRITQRWV